MTATATSTPTSNKKVDLSNGFAEIRTYTTRKLDREYKAAISKGMVMDSEGKATMSDAPLNMELANDILVLNSLTRLNINGEDLDITQESLDKMPANDFSRLLNACVEVKQATDKLAKEDKKKSSAASEAS